MNAKKKYIFIAAIVLLAVLILLFGWNIFLKRWKIKGANEISSIGLFIISDDGYRKAEITSSEDINFFRDLTLDMENEITITNISHINKIERFQSDSQAGMVFYFGDNESQQIYIQNDCVVIFDYCIDSNYDDMYYMRLKNMDTDNLLDALYSHTEEIQHMNSETP